MADEALTAGAVARRLGVAVTTLRTWHQRYGLGPSHHVPGQHRRYTPEDMDRLQVMRRLTAQGVAPAEAAAWARRVPVPIDVSTPLVPPQPEPAAPPSADPAPATAAAGPGPSSGSGPPLRDDRHGPRSPDASAAESDALDGVRSSDQSPTGAPEPSPSPGESPESPRIAAAEPAPSAAEAALADLGPSAHEAAFRKRLPTPDPHRGEDSSPSPTPDDHARPQHEDATFHRVGEQRSPGLDAVWPEETGRMFVTRDGGGRTIRTGRAGPAARGLARAAMRLDGPALRDILEMTVTDRGVVAAWEEVIMPVLIGVGERYAATKKYITVEHILSRGITEVLGSVTRPPSSQIPRVLLAAADEELHTLPLEALAAALAQAGVSSRLLGARVPAEAVAEAIARTGPAVVVLWSQLPGSADPAQWAHILAGPHRPVLVAAAGPGWATDKLPDEVTPLGSLADAVRLVSAIARPADQPR